MLESERMVLLNYVHALFWCNIELSESFSTNLQTMSTIQNIKIGVRAIIVQDDKILMVKHLEQEKEFYIFPGGGLEKNESIFKAVEREVSEETNIKVKPEKLIYFREFVETKSYGAEFYILCSLVNGEDKISLGADPEKNEPVLVGTEWVTIEKLSELVWYPEELHGHFLNDYKNNFKDFRNLGTIDL